MAALRLFWTCRKTVLVGLFVVVAIVAARANERLDASGLVERIVHAVTASQEHAASSATAAATTGPLPLRPPAVCPWRPIFRGIDHATAETSTPVPMKLNALRIHLQEPGIEFLVTPSNGDAPLDTTGTWTSTFLKTYKCQAAINASPFSPVAQKETTPEDVLGLSVSRGDAYSPANDTYGALLISKDNKAWIATPPVKPKAAHNAVGGFRLLLKDGKNVAANDVRHPRTAVGISNDGQFLYLVVLDGRQKGNSEGATTAETAEWMRSFGAWDALNLDGGGSTAMVVSDGRGGAKALNRPIDLGLPGKERVVANHLGVFARPLETPAFP